MKLLAVILFLESLGWTYSATLNCKFKLFPDGYNCEMLEEFPEKDKAVSNVIGDHLDEKDDSKVDVFFASKPTKYSPFDLCTTFVKIYKFDIRSSILREISREFFKNCEKLRHVKIVSTLISSLHEDIFDDLTSLENLDMTDNRLEYLPEKLFINNFKLQKIDFNRNLLKLINLNLSTSLKRRILIQTFASTATFLGSILQ